MIAGGEALRAAAGAVPLATGTLMIGLPEWADVAPFETKKRFEDAEATIDGYALPAYAAIEVVAAAASEAATSGKPIADVLTEKQFTTAIGPIDFDDKGDLATNPYRLFRFDGDDVSRGEVNGVPGGAKKSDHRRCGPARRQCVGRER